MRLDANYTIDGGAYQVLEPEDLTQFDSEEELRDGIHEMLCEFAEWTLHVENMEEIVEAWHKLRENDADSKTDVEENASVWA